MCHRQRGPDGIGKEVYLEFGATMGRCDDRGCGGSDDNDESTKVRRVEHDWMRRDRSTSDTEWVSGSGVGYQSKDSERPPVAFIRGFLLQGWPSS